jgi:hypothetical protein
MPTSITRHVRSLTISTTTEAFEPFWQDFTRLVRSEWRRLRVRGQPPGILGYPGYRSWHDAWEEIQNAAYVEAVLQRAPELLAALQGQPPGTSLDALVRLNIRYHFQARRELSDPIGACVYRRVCSVLRRMVDAGALAAAPLRNGRHFRRDTILSSPGIQSVGLTSAAELKALLPTLPDWPRLRVLLACTRRIPRLPAHLTAFVGALGQAGCRRFRLMDLVELMQQTARDAARELMRSRVGTPVGAYEGQELAQRLSRPDDDMGGYSSAGDFKECCQRIRRRIESSCRDDARRNRLRGFEACLPALRQGYWPSVREVVNLLSQTGTPVARGSVGDHLRIVKGFWEEEEDR